MTPADLLAIRKRLGLTQAELAPLVGAASDRTVRKWENGERAIPPHVPIILGAIKPIYPQDLRPFVARGA